jgi:hypothetical protein
MSFWYVRVSLLITFAVCVSGANTYFVNPGFETADLTGWALSSTDYNCLVDRRASTIAGCPNDPSVGSRTPRDYVHPPGNYGMMLGSYNENGPETLTQTVTLTLTGGYYLNFDFRERDYYTSETPLNSFEAVWGPDLANLTSIFAVTNQASGNWSSQSIWFNVPTAGTYVFGFRFNNGWGEWALDDTGLTKNPEPGTMLLMGGPLAFLGWKRRRALKVRGRASGS